MGPEVRFEPTGFQTSMALAAVSGKPVTATLVPATEGVVGLPVVFVVPLRARLAQLVHRAPSTSRLESFLPTVKPRLANQSPAMLNAIPPVPMKVSAPAWLCAPGPRRLSASNRTVSEVTPGGP